MYSRLYVCVGCGAASREWETSAEKGNGSVFSSCQPSFDEAKRVPGPSTTGLSSPGREEKDNVDMPRKELKLRSEDIKPHSNRTIKPFFKYFSNNQPLAGATPC